ncbi:MAG: ribosome small subunit-dependent GTPase A [Nostocoides sp.]
MSRSARDYDESDVRVRPNRRGSRPRTKERPAHKDAVPGMVIGVDRGRYRVILGGGIAGSDPPRRSVTAMKARELGRGGIVVGDRVDLVGDVSGGPDALARIVRVHERETVLRRTADDADPVERVLVANADQLVIVSAVANPAPSPRLIDRCLVAAYDAGMECALVLTKADLGSAEPLIEVYAPLGVTCLVTSRDGSHIVGLAQVEHHLEGRISVLVGPSGVGKSTLVNALVPDADRATGSVNDVTGRGRHTSTSAVALELPGGMGWVVDTPGVRSFGLAHVDPETIVDHFPDLASGTGQCPRGCGHDEPECGLDAWVESGAAGPAGAARLDSLRRLLRSAEATRTTNSPTPDARRPTPENAS